jgi:hypothetical protein
MSDSLRPHRPIEWSLVLTLVAMIVGATLAFGVVREQGNSNTDKIGKLEGATAEHGVQLQKMREDRSIETKIYDLTLEVRLLRQEVEQSNKKKR